MCMVCGGAVDYYAVQTAVNTAPAVTSSVSSTASTVATMVAGAIFFRFSSPVTRKVRSLVQKFRKK